MLKKIALVCLLSLMVFSCEKQQFIVNKNTKYTQMPTNPTYQEWDNQFLWGLIPTSKHNVSEICNGDADIVGTKKTFLNGFLGAITWGIYSPRTYQVQCSNK